MLLAMLSRCRLASGAGENPPSHSREAPFRAGYPYFTQSQLVASAFRGTSKREPRRQKNRLMVPLLLVNTGRFNRLQLAPGERMLELVEGTHATTA